MGGVTQTTQSQLCKIYKVWRSAGQYRTYNKQYWVLYNLFKRVYLLLNALIAKETKRKTFGGDRQVYSVYKFLKMYLSQNTSSWIYLQLFMGIDYQG